MDPERIPKIRAAMEAEGLSILLCRSVENVLYISGYYPVTGWSLVVLPLDGEPTLIVPASEMEHAQEGWIKDVRVYKVEGLNEVWNPYRLIARILGDIGLPKGVKVGCELGLEAAAVNATVCEVRYPCNPTFELIRKTLDAELVDISRLLARLRMIKSRHEINRIRISAEVAALAVETVLENLSEGVRECELAAIAEKTVYGKGVGFKEVKRARGFAYIMSGENSSRAWYPFNISTSRRIRKGDVVLLELNVCADGYWVDITRTWIFGKPSTEQEEMFHVLLEAQEEAYRLEQDGVAASEVDGAARELIASRGYSKLFPHRLGHGIGLRVHEPPALHPASEDLLSRRVVHTVEPGLYTNKFGMRLEDTVVVESRGIRNLFDRYKFLSLKR